jgi:hypothetical protein
MKLKLTLNKKKSDEENDDNESDEDDNSSENNTQDNENYNSVDNDKNSEENMQIDNQEDDDKINEIEFEEAVQQKSSGLMILELCQNIEDKILFPLLSNFLCIVAPLKILEALKTSHIYWPTNFYKNISDLHFLRILLNYNNKVQRDETIELY